MAMFRFADSVDRALDGRRHRDGARRTSCPSQQGRRQAIRAGCRERARSIDCRCCSARSHVVLSTHRRSAPPRRSSSSSTALPASTVTAFGLGLVLVMSTPAVSAIAAEVASRAASAASAVMSFFMCRDILWSLSAGRYPPPRTRPSGSSQYEQSPYRRCTYRAPSGTGREQQGSQGGAMTRNAAAHVQTNDAADRTRRSRSRAAPTARSPLGERYATGGRGSRQAASRLPELCRARRRAATGCWSRTPAAATSLSPPSSTSGSASPTRSPRADRRRRAVAVDGSLVYVLNDGSASLSGFRIEDVGLAAIADSARSLSSPDADGAQVAFSPDGKTLVVTERGARTASRAFAVRADGTLDGPSTIPSSGATPYGFETSPATRWCVTEALSAAPWAPRRHPRTRSRSRVGSPCERLGLPKHRSEVCWPP